MPLLQRGELVGEGQQQDRYRVRRKVGEGQFSEVYEVEDTAGGGLYALKIERSPDVRTVRQECKTLRRLQQCAQICKARGSGTYGDRFYMVLDLLGNNLVEARRGVQGGRMDLSTAKHVALSLLVPLEAMHREGFIHRDVKPANYAIYPPGAASTEGQWTLIDFGLARRYVDDEGKLLPERTDASFRGSSTYASAQVMEHRDQGRRDDLWSWLYVVVELIAGTLPWRFDGEGGEKPNREAVLLLKQSCMADPRQLVGARPCPQAIVELSTYLTGLQFDAEPNYDWVRSLVSRLDEGAPGSAPDEAEPMAIDQALGQQQQQQQHQQHYQQQHPPGDPSSAPPLAGQGSAGEPGAGVAVPVAAWGGSAAPGPPAESPPPPPPLLPPPASGSPLPLVLDLEGILTMPGWSGGQSDAAALGCQQAAGQLNGTHIPVPAMQLQARVEASSQQDPASEAALPRQGSGLALNGASLAAGALTNEPELSPLAVVGAEVEGRPGSGLAGAEAGVATVVEPAAAPATHEAMPAIQQQQQRRAEKARQLPEGGAPSAPRRHEIHEAQQQAAQQRQIAANEAAGDARDARRAPQEQQPERPREGLTKPPRSRPSSAAAAGTSASVRDPSDKTGGKGHAGRAPTGLNGAAVPAASAAVDAAVGSGGGGVSKRGAMEGTTPGSQADKGKRSEKNATGSGSRAGGGVEGNGRDGRHGRGQSGERLKDSRPTSSSQQRPQPRRRGSSRSRSRSRSPRSPSLSPSRSRSESYHRQQQQQQQRKRRRSYSRSPSSSTSRSRSRSHSRRRSDRSRDRERDRERDRSRSRDRDRDSRDRSRSRDRERDRRERRDRRGDRSRSRSRTRYRSRSKERPEPASKGRQQDASAPLSDSITKRYREMLDYVFALKQGSISSAGEKACRQLRALAPAEALGAICWMLDDVGSQATAKQSQLAAQVLEDVAAFAAGLAKKCVELQETRP